MLSYVTTHVMEAQCAELEQDPIEEEVRKIQKGLPREKVPGLDG